MSVYRLSERSGGVIGTIGPIGGSGVFSLQERYALTADNYENVSLYLKMNGANGSTTFYDSSLYRHAVTANGNAQISTAQSKFGGASAAFDGTGDYLTSSFTSNLSTDNFTLELWAYMASFSSQFQAIYDGRVPGAATANCLIFYVNPSQKLVVDVSGSAIYTSSSSLSLSQWVHLAIVRAGTSSNQATLYINGVADGSFTLSTNITGGGTVIGAFAFNPLGVYPFDGYIDDLRITKGVARYTSNFTPPQREFLP